MLAAATSINIFFIRSVLLSKNPVKIRDEFNSHSKNEFNFVKIYCFALPLIHFKTTNLVYILLKGQCKICGFYFLIF